jgi:hypothetical protein
MVVAAREADIFPDVCRVRRGTATLDGALCDMAGASSSLPIVELEMYSSSWRCTRRQEVLCCQYVRNVADLVAALILVAQWCRAPVDALTVLQTQDVTTQSDLSTKEVDFRTPHLDTYQGQGHTGSERSVYPKCLGALSRL